MTAIKGTPTVGVPFTSFSSANTAPRAAEPAPKQTPALFRQDVFAADNNARKWNAMFGGDTAQTGGVENPSKKGGTEDVSQARKTDAALPTTVAEATTMLNEVYGVEVSGDWELAELQTVLSTFRTVDNNLRLLDDNPNTPRGEMFRHFFGEVVIERVNEETLGGPYAANVYDEEAVPPLTTLRFSNSAFSEEVGDIISNTPTPITSPQLIAHELAHTLNNRFPSPSGGNLTNYFNEQVGSDSEHTLNTGGLGFRATTNKDAWPEGLADVFANYMLASFTPDAAGRTRRANATELLTALVDTEPR